MIIDRYSTINKSYALLALVAILSAGFLNACDKDREHPVPYVHVEFNFNIIHYNLNSPGLSHQFSQSESGGVQGIIVYRLSMDEFRAYDRACPCDPFHCKVSIKEDDLLRATDPCCGSVFLLIDGTVTEGDAGFPLKTYRTEFNEQTNRLRITN